MRAPPTIVCVTLVLGLLDGYGAVARAEPPAQSILVLGVMVDEHLDRRLTETLERYLGTTEQVIPFRALRPEERKCDEPSCLYALARRKEAAVLLGVKVTHTGPTEVELELHHINAQSRTWRRARDVASSEQLEERIKQLTRQILRGPVLVRPHAKAPLMSPAQRPQLPPDFLMKLLKTLPPERHLSPVQKGGIPLLVLGGLSLGAAALVSAFSLKYNTAERCFGNYRKDCVDNGTPLADAGYIASGGFFLSGIMSLTIPAIKKGRR